MSLLAPQRYIADWLCYSWTLALWGKKGEEDCNITTIKLGISKLDHKLFVKDSQREES